MVTEEQINIMRERLTDEVYYALFKKRNGKLRRWLGRLVWVPATRFARIFAEADDQTSRDGLHGGAKSMINSLDIALSASGSEQIPAEGPLLVVANHPGAYDSVALCASIPRPDIKIIAFEIPFYRTLPNISPRMIFATEDTAERMLTLRTAIRHLQEGGVVVQFGTGKIDPDPAVQPGASNALADWMPSIELMLRKVPQTRLVVSIVSGVMEKQFARHPLTILHREPIDKRRLAEFLQVIQMLMKPSSIDARANLTFAPAVDAQELAEESTDHHIMAPIISHARSLLNIHVQQNSGVI